MKSLLIVANKNAGTRAVQFFREARRILWGWKIEVCTPSSQDDLKSAIESLDPEQFKAVITIGGDGTVNGALPAMIESRIPLLTFPAGTANDLAGALEITADWNKVQRIIDRQLIREIDLITVNGIPFATIGGLGVGTAMIASFNDNRRSLGVQRIAARMLTGQVYGVLAMRAIINDDYSQPKVLIQYGETEIESYVGSLLVCNQGTFGKDICICANSKMDDGQFEVNLLRPGRMHIIRSLMAAKTSKGGIVGDHDFSAEKMVVKSLSGENLCAFGDGEVLLEDQELVFEVKKRALRVYHARKAEL